MSIVKRQVSIWLFLLRQETRIAIVLALLALLALPVAVHQAWLTGGYCQDTQQCCLSETFVFLFWAGSPGCSILWPLSLGVCNAAESVHCAECL